MLAARRPRFRAVAAASALVALVALGGLATVVSAVANPTSGVSGASTSPEGSAYELTLAGTDANGRSDTLLFAIDWGDGTLTSQVLLPPGVVTHTFVDGPMTANVLVMIYDQMGGATRVDLPVSVLNVAPTVALTGSATTVVDTSYSLTIGAVADPGRDTVTSTTIRWGDGTTQAAAPGTTVTHTYRTPGSMAIGVDLVDDDGTWTAAGSLAVSVANAAPPAPANLAATATSRSSITVSWTNLTTNQGSVEIQRCKGAGCTSFKQIATVAGAATSYLDQKLSSNTVYVYRVRARNVVGASGWSNLASARTPR